MARGFGGLSSESATDEFLNGKSLAARWCRINLDYHLGRSAVLPIHLGPSLCRWRTQPRRVAQAQCRRSLRAEYLTEWVFRSG